MFSPANHAATLAQALESKRTFTSSDGLVQNTVYDIEQDLNGFIWLATQSGVARFDGYAFENFGRASSSQPGLSSIRTLDLELDKHTGDLWIGTANGLNRIDAQTGKIESIPIQSVSGEPHERFSALHVDTTGTLWAMADHTLLVQDKQTKAFVSIPFDNPYPQINVHELETDTQNILYIASSIGLLRYDINTGTWLSTLYEGKLVLSAFIDNEQALWVGTNSEGLFHIEFDVDNSPLRTRQITTEQGLSNNIVYDIAQTHSGDVWVATNKGVSIFPNHKTGLSLVPANLGKLAGKNDNDSIVYSLFVDAYDQVLYGTLIHGFSIVSPETILFDTLPIGTTQVAYSTDLDNEENLWITSPEGLWKFDTQLTNSRLYDFIDGDVNAGSANILLKVYHSKFDDTLWISTRAGLARLNNAKSGLITAGFEDVPIYSLSGDSKGNLYVGTTSSGFYHYNPNNSEILSHYETGTVLGIHVSNEEKVWLATSEGVVKINPIEKTKVTYIHNPNDPNSIVHNVVTWISDKSNGQYLVATQAKGVQLMEEDSSSGEVKFTSLFPETELSKVSIGAIRKGVDGNYWITTINGIVKMDSTLSALTYYDKTDGVSSDGYFISANSMNSKGRIFFAGSDGVTHFHPDEIVRPKSIPPLHITRISILNEDLGLREVNAKSNPIKPINNTPLNIDHNDIVVTIDVAAAELISPQSVQYAYRLRGFNNQWLNLDSSKRSITYTSLNSGTYTLEVKSSDRYGNFNSEPVSLKIVVTPPWYSTNIALACWFILIILSIYLYAKWRSHEQFLRSEQLAIEVANKTKDLKVANEKLRVISNLDPLTKIYNRRGFTYFANKQLKLLSALDESSALVLFDIDYFKKINDNYGHDVGDEILVLVSDTIQSRLRADDVLGRWGGEEFIVMLPKADIASAQKVANDICATLSSNPIEVLGQKVNVTLSGGVAPIKTESKNKKALHESIKQADILLYEAKHKGRNQICV